MKRPHYSQSRRFRHECRRVNFSALWASGLAMLTPIGLLNWSKRDCNKASPKSRRRASSSPMPADFLIVDKDGFGDFHNARRFARQIELVGAGGEDTGGCHRWMGRNDRSVSSAFKCSYEPRGLCSRLPCFVLSVALVTAARSYLLAAGMVKKVASTANDASPDPCL